MNTIPHELQALIEAGENITGSERRFTLPLPKPDLMTTLRSWLKGKRPAAERHYAITPALTGTLFRIGQRILKADGLMTLQRPHTLPDAIRLAATHGPELTQIAWLLIRNENCLIDDDQVQQLGCVMTGEHLLKLIGLMLEQMQTGTLMNYYGLHKPASEADQDEEYNPLNINKAQTPWGLIGGICKHFGWTEEYVLWRLSWAKLSMYSATIPDYSSKGKDGPGKMVNEEDELDELMKDLGD